VSVERNKATFRRYVEEVGNKGNLDLAYEIFDRYISHQSDGRTEERGPEDVRRFIGEFHRAFPDFRTTIEYQVAEGDKIVEEWERYDNLSMMQQLGVVTEPGQGAG